MTNELQAALAALDEAIFQRNEWKTEAGKLKAERDEARRSLCECSANGACDSRDGDWFADDGRHILAREYAAERGWSCFKEDTK
jgi:hypothetical protein